MWRAAGVLRNLIVSRLVPTLSEYKSPSERGRLTSFFQEQRNRVIPSVSLDNNG